MTRHERGEPGTDEARFVERLSDAVRKHYHVASETPRDEMWAVIQAIRAETSGRAWKFAPGGAADEERAGVGPIRRLRPQPWWAGVAAALVAGLLLGRSELFRPAAEAPPVVAVDAATGTPSGEEGLREAGRRTDALRPYRTAAAAHLSRTESFLTMYRADRGSDELGGEIGPWAQSLLTDTRLLLGSPAARDPELERLLQDLELILAQIVQRRSEDPQDAELIEEGMEERQLLFRLRAASTAGPAVSGI